MLLDTEVLRFLQYTRVGNIQNDIIPLALVQLKYTSFLDIFWEEDEIHALFTQYEAPDGKQYKILKGHHEKFVLAVLYAQFQFSQVKTDIHAKDPSKWTNDEFDDWEYKICIGCLEKN